MANLNFTVNVTPIEKIINNVLVTSTSSAIKVFFGITLSGDELGANEKVTFSINCEKLNNQAFYLVDENNPTSSSIRQNYATFTEKTTQYVVAEVPIINSETISFTYSAVSNNSSTKVTNSSTGYSFNVGNYCQKATNIEEFKITNGTQVEITDNEESENVIVRLSWTHHPGNTSNIFDKVVGYNIFCEESWIGDVTLPTFVKRTNSDTYTYDYKLSRISVFKHMKKKFESSGISSEQVKFTIIAVKAGLFSSEAKSVFLDIVYKRPIKITDMWVPGGSATNQTNIRIRNNMNYTALSDDGREFWDEYGDNYSELKIMWETDEIPDRTVLKAYTYFGPLSANLDIFRIGRETDCSSIFNYSLVGNKYVCGYSYPAELNRTAFEFLGTIAPNGWDDYNIISITSESQFNSAKKQYGKVYTKTSTNTYQEASIYVEGREYYVKSTVYQVFDPKQVSNTYSQGQKVVVYRDSEFIKGYSKTFVFESKLKNNNPKDINDFFDATKWKRLFGDTGYEQEDAVSMNTTRYTAFEVTVYKTINGKETYFKKRSQVIKIERRPIIRNFKIADADLGGMYPYNRENGFNINLYTIPEKTDTDLATAELAWGIDRVTLAEWLGLNLDTKNKSFKELIEMYSKNFFENVLTTYERTRNIISPVWFDLHLVIKSDYYFTLKSDNNDHYDIILNKDDAIAYEYSNGEKTYTPKYEYDIGEYDKDFVDWLLSADHEHHVGIDKDKFAFFESGTSETNYSKMYQAVIAQIYSNFEPLQFSSLVYYNVGDIVQYNNKVYICKVAGTYTTGDLNDNTKWTATGKTPKTYIEENINTVKGKINTNTGSLQRMFRELVDCGYLTFRLTQYEYIPSVYLQTYPVHWECPLCNSKFVVAQVNTDGTMYVFNGNNASSYYKKDNIMSEAISTVGKNFNLFRSARRNYTCPYCDTYKPFDYDYDIADAWYEKISGLKITNTPDIPLPLLGHTTKTYTIYVQLAINNETEFNNAVAQYGTIYVLSEYTLNKKTYSPASSYTANTDYYKKETHTKTLSNLDLYDYNNRLDKVLSGLFYKGSEDTAKSFYDLKTLVSAICSGDLSIIDNQGNLSIKNYIDSKKALLNSANQTYSANTCDSNPGVKSYLDLFKTAGSYIDEFRDYYKAECATCGHTLYLDILYRNGSKIVCPYCFSSSIVSKVKDYNGTQISGSDVAEIICSSYQDAKTTAVDTDFINFYHKMGRLDLDIMAHYCPYGNITLLTPDSSSGNIIIKSYELLNNNTQHIEFRYAKKYGKVSGFTINIGCSNKNIDWYTPTNINNGLRETLEAPKHIGDNETYSSVADYEEISEYDATVRKYYYLDDNNYVLDATIVNSETFNASKEAHETLYYDTIEANYKSYETYYNRSGDGTKANPFSYTVNPDVTASNFDDLKDSLYINNIVLLCNSFNIPVANDSRIKEDKKYFYASFDVTLLKDRINKVINNMETDENIIVSIEVRPYYAVKGNNSYKLYGKDRKYKKNDDSNTNYYYTDYGNISYLTGYFTLFELDKININDPYLCCLMPNEFATNVYDMSPAIYDLFEFTSVDEYATFNPNITYYYLQDVDEYVIADNVSYENFNDLKDSLYIYGSPFTGNYHWYGNKTPILTYGLSLELDKEVAFYLNNVSLKYNTEQSLSGRQYIGTDLPVIYEEISNYNDNIIDYYYIENDEYILDTTIVDSETFNASKQSHTNIYVVAVDDFIYTITKIPYFSPETYYRYDDIAVYESTVYRCVNDETTATSADLTSSDWSNLGGYSIIPTTPTTTANSVYFDTNDNNNLYIHCNDNENYKYSDIQAFQTSTTYNENNVVKVNDTSSNAIYKCVADKNDITNNYFWNSNVNFINLSNLHTQTYSNIQPFDSQRSYGYGAIVSYTINSTSYLFRCRSDNNGRAFYTEINAYDSNVTNYYYLDNNAYVLDSTVIDSASFDASKLAHGTLYQATYWEMLVNGNTDVSIDNYISDFYGGYGEGSIVVYQGWTYLRDNNGDISTLGGQPFACFRIAIGEIILPISATNVIRYNNTKNYEAEYLYYKYTTNNTGNITFDFDAYTKIIGDNNSTIPASSITLKTTPESAATIGDIYYDGNSNYYELLKTTYTSSANDYNDSRLWTQIGTYYKYANGIQIPYDDGTTYELYKNNSGGYVEIESASDFQGSDWTSLGECINFVDDTTYTVYLNNIALYNNNAYKLISVKRKFTVEELADTDYWEVNSQSAQVILCKDIVPNNNSATSGPIFDTACCWYINLIFNPNSITISGLSEINNLRLVTHFLDANGNSALPINYGDKDSRHTTNSADRTSGSLYLKFFGFNEQNSTQDYKIYSDTLDIDTTQESTQSINYGMYCPNCKKLYPDRSKYYYNDNFSIDVIDEDGNTLNIPLYEKDDTVDILSVRSYSIKDKKEIPSGLESAGGFELNLTYCKECSSYKEILSYDDTIHNYYYRYFNVNKGKTTYVLITISNEYEEISNYNDNIIDYYYLDNGNYILDTTIVDSETFNTSKQQHTNIYVYVDNFAIAKNTYKSLYIRTSGILEPVYNKNGILYVKSDIKGSYWAVRALESFNGFFGYHTPAYNQMMRNHKISEEQYKVLLENLQNSSKKANMYSGEMSYEDDQHNVSNNPVKIAEFDYDNSAYKTNSYKGTEITANGNYIETTYYNDDISTYYYLDNGNYISVTIDDYNVISTYDSTIRNYYYLDDSEYILDETIVDSNSFNDSLQLHTTLYILAKDEFNVLKTTHTTLYVKCYAAIDKSIRNELYTILTTNPHSQVNPQLSMF